MMPKNCRLFHISQTIPLDAPKGTRPDAWNNKSLVREGTYEDGNPVETQKAEKAAEISEESEPLETPVETLPIQRPIDNNGRIQSTLAEVKEPAGDCNCPMVDVITNVDCPIHGDRS